MPPKRRRPALHVSAILDTPTAKRRNRLSQSDAGASPTSPDLRLVNNQDGAHGNGIASQSQPTRKFANISCAALENSVGQYHGSQSGCPEEWLQSYERYCNLKGWDDETRAMAMPLYLRSGALQWFDSLPADVKQNFTNIKLAFTKTFTIGRTQMLAELDALASRKQQPGEPLEGYILDITARCRRLKRSSDQVFECVLQGLQTHVKRQVLLQQASTIEDIRRIGLLCELCPENTPQPQQQPAQDRSVMELVATLTEKVQEQENTIAQLKKTTARTTDKKSAKACTKCGRYNCRGKAYAYREKCFAFNKECNNCKKMHHFSNVCRNKKTVENQSTNAAPASNGDA